MPDPSGPSLRALVLHPDERVRERLAELLRRSGATAQATAASLAEGLRIAPWFEPDLVLLDLGTDAELSASTIRDLAAPGRFLVGLRNPQLPAHRDAELARLAVRSGLGDFLTLPPSEAELGAVLARLHPTAPPGEGQVLAFLGARGGVGATTLATSLALMLAGSGEAGEVALCDADLQFGDAAMLLGLNPPSDLGDLVREIEDPGAVTPFLAHQESTGLRILARPASLETADSVRPEEISRVLLLLRRRFDRVVVDTAPCLDLLNLGILDLAEKIFVVTTAVAPAVRATARLLEALAALGTPAERIRIVVNRYQAFEGNLAPGSVAEHLGRPVDHLLAEDRSLIAAAHLGRPAILSRTRTELAEVVGKLADDAVRPVRMRRG